MALSEYSKDLIKEYIPSFDFSKERSPQEMRAAVSVAYKLKKKAIIASRTADILSRGMHAGAVVVNGADEEEVVRTISTDGHLVFEGKRGSFNPAFWKKKE